jgi:two-component system sensor histidine kinase HydH
LLGAEASARAIGIVTQVDPALPIFLADGGQLTQALINLVINALQAVGSNGQIEIQARREEVEGEVTIGVRDSGPGIPSEKLAAVFEPYFTTKEEGSGLGLWIAQQIAVAHGGTLRAGNAPQGGAVFTLSLPLRVEGQARG